MKVNLCKADGPISFCRAKNRGAQENCTFFDDSAFKPDCLWLTFNNYCTSWWAQHNKIPPDSSRKSDPSAIYEPCEGCSYHKTCSKRATTAECNDEEKKKAGVKAFKDK